MFIPFLKSHFEHVCINTTKQVILRLETFNKQRLFPMTLQRTAETAKWAIGAGFPMTDSYNFIIRPPWQPSIVNIWLHPRTLKVSVCFSTDKWIHHDSLQSAVFHWHLSAQVKTYSPVFICAPDTHVMLHIHPILMWMQSSFCAVRYIF